MSKYLISIGQSTHGTKMYRRVFSAMLLCGLLVSFFDITLYGATRSEVEEYERLSMKQAPLISIYDEFCKLFQINQAELRFPEGYGGAYLQDDYLVIKVKQGYSDFQKTITKVIPMDKTLIEETDVSLAELYQLAKMIYSDLVESCDLRVNISISQKSSKVIIGIDDRELEGRDYEQIMRYAQNMHVTFKESHVKATGYVYGGDSLYRKSGSMYYVLGTLGFCGYYNGLPAILTAGHMAKYYSLYFGVGNVVNVSGTEGVVQFENYQAGDYAIIPITNYSTNLISNMIRTSSSGNYLVINGMSTNLNNLEGTLVIKYGYSTGVTAAYVTATGYAHSVSTYGNGSKYIYQLVSVSNENSSISFCEQGDSGGPVYRVTSGGSRLAMGTVSAKEDAAVCAGYYSPISLPNNMGFIIY